MELKDTLLLPKTDFPMRGNLGVRETDFQEKWESIDLYQKTLELNKNGKSFILHDGPPYANGSVHIGHALNKIIKDFILRYKTLSGYYAPYIPGWDTHGLPIETALTKKGVNRKELEPFAFRMLCAEFAMEQVETQKGQFKRLGILGDWNNPYITLQKTYESDQIRVFSKMAEKGLIYKGLKPVYWSPSSESALAEAEIEYQDVKSPSIYVSFEVVEGAFKGAHLIIWTTTPWTLPANLAISANPRMNYVLFEANQKQYIVAETLLKQVSEILEFENKTILKTFKGTDLEYSIYLHPLNHKKLPVILGDHVTDTDGTGLVHTAPGHGEDDYNVGMKYNLDILVPVDDRGFFTSEAGEFEGLYYESANPKIIDRLKELGALLHVSYFTHSYPHDWRTKKPVIFRATPQWFASIESLRNQLLDEIKKVNWVQSWGELRIHNMIEGRGDWCISRQRAWGVPIPVFYSEDGQPILDPKLIDHVADIFEAEGSNAWYKYEAKDLLPKGYTHPKSPNNIFIKETDTMDVWFDSGSSHQLLKRRGLTYPADLYVEGSDQYRGWFNSSLTTGVAVTGKAPYKTVLSHGFVLDDKGRAMSKSLGNTVDPNKIIKMHGADILRLWVSSVDYSSDVKIGDEMIKQASETYRKIRNTFKYMLSNLFDFEPTKNRLDFDELDKLDQVMLVKLETLKGDVYKAYEEYRFDAVNRLITNYIINDLSAYYLDYSKDILYIEAANSPIRRGTQTVIYHHLMTLLKLLNPIIPHTTSEAYWLLPFAHKEDVYLERFDEVIHYEVGDLMENFEAFYTVRDAVLLTLEQLRKDRVIGKSLEADLTIKLPKKMKESIDKLETNLIQVLMVSHIHYEISDKLEVSAKPSVGHKCERCWNYVDELNDEQVCPRCEKVLEELDEYTSR